MKVLVAEYDVVLRNLIGKVLETEGLTPVLVEDGDEMLDVMADDKDVSLIILDWRLPGADAVALLASIQAFESAALRRIRRLLLVPRETPEIFDEARKAGADDCLGKPFLAPELASHLDLLRRLDSLSAEVESLTEQVHRLGQTDGMTDLLSHDAVFQGLVKELKRAEREGDTISIILLDIDNFRGVNDQYGHAAGDAVLRQMAKIIQHDCRVYDTIGRWSGERFMVIMPGIDIKDAYLVAERLRTSIADAVFDHEDLLMRVTASLGVVTARFGKEYDPEDLIHRADDALYEAKAKGRNRTECDGGDI